MTISLSKIVNVLPFSRLFSLLYHAFIVLSWHIRFRYSFFVLPWIACRCAEGPSETSSLPPRQLELDMETVVKVLQPGPLGIVEHKFVAEEIQKASGTVKQAVSNWLKQANIEKHSPIMKDFIDI